MISYKILGAAFLMIMVSKAFAQENGYGYEEYGHPQYTFQYEVKDEHTKDIKSQQETRDGHSVKGFYTLLQSDGRTRTVHYNADEKLGFNAVVNYEGGAYEYAPAPLHYSAPAPAAPRYNAPSPRYELPRSHSQSGYSRASASVSTPHFSYSY